MLLRHAAASARLSPRSSNQVNAFVQWRGCRAGRLVAALFTAQVGLISTAHAAGITTDGRTNTTVNTQGAITDVTTTTVSGRNAFNAFSTFNVDAQQTVNLHVPNGAQNLINLVRDERSTINGTVNGVQNGAIGGTVYLLNPHGVIVGPQGRLNMGNLFVMTPTQRFVDDFFDAPGRANETSVAQVLNGTAARNADASIVVDGQINATGDVSLSAGAIVVGGQIWSGARFVTQAPDFSDVVNVRDVVGATQIVQREGRVFLSADRDITLSDAVIDAGRDLELRAGAVRVTASTHRLVTGGNLTLEARDGGLGEAGAALNVAFTRPETSGLSADAMGDIAINALGDLPIEHVVSRGGNAWLWSSGALRGGSSQAGPHVQADHLMLSAATIGAGELAPLRTQVRTLDATATQSAVDLDEADGLAQLDVHAVGPIFFTSHGGSSGDVGLGRLTSAHNGPQAVRLTIDGALLDTNGTALNIDAPATYASVLVRTGEAMEFDSAARRLALHSQNGSIMLRSTTDIASFDAQAQSDIAVFAQALRMNEDQQIRSARGRIALEGTGDLTLTGISTGNNTADAVRLVTTGRLLDAGDARLDVAADAGDAGLAIDARQGVGADGNGLEVAAGLLVAHSAAGAIALNESTGLADLLVTAHQNVRLTVGDDFNASFLRSTTGDVSVRGRGDAAIAKTEAARVLNVSVDGTLKMGDAQASVMNLYAKRDFTAQWLSASGSATGSIAVTAGRHARVDFVVAPTVSISAGGDARLAYGSADDLSVASLGTTHVEIAEVAHGFNLRGRYVLANIAPGNSIGGNAKLRYGIGTGERTAVTGRGTPILGAVTGGYGGQADYAKVSVYGARPTTFTQLYARAADINVSVTPLTVLDAWLGVAHIWTPATYLLADTGLQNTSDVQIASPDRRYRFMIEGAQVRTDGVVIHRRDAYTTLGAVGRDTTALEAADRWLAEIPAPNPAGQAPYREPSTVSPLEDAPLAAQEVAQLDPHQASTR
ncbi:MAG TPA: leukotoxin LktA family filamentous adhesin [Burkholderiaceae bacterium]|nr:leukotoxin LktA family filamentous adhesin [Burkholderiaceae bacterium]